MRPPMSWTNDFRTLRALPFRMNVNSFLYCRSPSPMVPNVDNRHQSPNPNKLIAFSPRTFRLFSSDIFLLFEIGPVTCPGCDESQWGESVASTKRSPPRYSTAHSNSPSSKGSQPT